jgi:UDP-2,3-diacylglucosamine pyrophosphatase LpxH
MPPSDLAAADSYDCLVISDLHLGSDVCQARLLEDFLNWAAEHSRMLVINGDIFDDLNFKRLTKRHFSCLRVIRRHSDRPDFRLIWIRGNHDGPAEIVSHIVGVEILDEYVFANDHVRLLMIHGDQFDHIITNHKVITTLASGLFYYIQKWMPHRAARWIRRTSKRFQRNSQVVQKGAIDYARSRDCTHVTCGHTHLSLTAAHDGFSYFNTGTWTEHPPCPFLAVRGGQVELLHWPTEHTPTLPGLAATAEAKNPD